MFIFTEENIKNITKLVYSQDGMDEKRLKKVEFSKNEGLFKDFNYDKYKITNPPKNSSMQTYSELNYLMDLPEDFDYVKEHDDIEKVFESVCIEHNIKFPKELVNDLIKSSAGIILDLKFKFNRPRPFQLASHYNMKLSENVLESMKTPSYPSGHSIQGILVGKVLQTKLPITTDSFLEAGKRISYSRNIGRAHYPSDSKVGEDIGTAMYEFIKNKL
jgi:hypothetical protein